MARTVRTHAQAPDGKTADVEGVRPWYRRESRSARKVWTRKNRRLLRAGQPPLRRTGGWMTH